MKSILEIAGLFFVSLAFGVSVFAPVASSQLTGIGFRKVLFGVSIGGLFLGLLLYSFFSPQLNLTISFYFASLVNLLSLYFLQKEGDPVKNKVLWSTFFLFVYIALIFSLNFQLKDILFMTISSLLLGSITYAMILGHWYLVVPGLTERPLKTILKIIWGVLLVKFIWAMIFFVMSYESLFTSGDLGSDYMFNWIILTMRLGWGYLIIPLMSYFAWKLVSMRSIQSATGVFYAMTFFVLIGELSSQILYFNHRMIL